MGVNTPRTNEHKEWAKEGVNVERNHRKRDASLSGVLERKVWRQLTRLVHRGVMLYSVRILWVDGEAINFFQEMP